MKRTLLAAILALCVTPTLAGEVYVGAWGGLVPASMELTGEKTLRFCQEDLVLRCHENVPYMLDGDTIVVEHLTSGRKWTYTPRPTGGYDAAYLQWRGDAGYELLTDAIFLPR